MKLRAFVYRLVALPAAFILGVGFFNAGQYLQSFFQTPETAAAVQPAVKKETLYVPPWVAPSPLYDPTRYAAPEPAADDKEEAKPEFSPDGDYYIIGALPKGFRDVEFLNIATKNYDNASEENNYEGVPIPPEGHILTEKKFDFDSINIDGKKISFETETKKGISYKFVGEFIEEEEIRSKAADGDEYSEYAVLKGRLVKMRDGKKIAEIKVKLAESIGC
jgi:hypothetical protein